jgi:hypothetical protein
MKIIKGRENKYISSEREPKIRMRTTRWNLRAQQQKFLQKKVFLVPKKGKVATISYTNSYKSDKICRLNPTK